jgi:hypothetical protein
MKKGDIYCESISKIWKLLNAEMKQKTVSNSFLINNYHLETEERIIL